MDQHRIISLCGILAMLLFAWLMSSHKRRVSPRIVVGGIVLQLVFAFLILGNPLGRFVFEQIGTFFDGVLGYVDKGSEFVFNMYPRGNDPPELVNGLPHPSSLVRSFAFGILPTIIFFSSLMSILYHIGIMQLIVRFFAAIMRWTLGTSGAETLSAAANIFVGQTEAPLVIRPYVADMTASELNVVMVGGFATIAGGVLAAFVGMGVDAGHLMTASVISAPAALVIAKILQPETEHSKTSAGTFYVAESQSVNVVEAAAEGASAGLHLALNVGAMLIAFVALIAMCDALVGLVGSWVGMAAERMAENNDAMVHNPAYYEWSLGKMFGYVFWPFAWLMGIPREECMQAGNLLGTKMVINEFVAYAQLSELKDGLSKRTFTILTYALCGFANFSSIGIQLGGIGGIAPERRSDLAKLGLRAMLGGTLAAFMTACIAGAMLNSAGEFDLDIPAMIRSIQQPAVEPAENGENNPDDADVEGEEQDNGTEPSESVDGKTQDGAGESESEPDADDTSSDPQLDPLEASRYASQLYSVT